jgi:hypothetical protein
LTPIYIVGGSCFIYVICVYLRILVKRRMSHMQQELLTIPEHMRSSPVFNGVRVARS